MAVDERRRHELHSSLEATLGRDPADTLMGMLPPVGWADVATRHDLSHLEERMNLRFEALQERLEKMAHKFRADLVIAIVALFAALAGLLSLRGGL